MLRHSVIERDLLHRVVFCKQVVVVGEVHELMRLFQNVTDLVSKNTCIPQRACFDVLLRRLHIRLFLKGFHRAHVVLADRDDVAVLLRGIGRLNAHHGQVAGIAFCQIGKLPECFKIVLIHVRIHGADHHRLVLRHLLHIVQIGRRQCNRREGIPSARLQRNTDSVPQLILQLGNLRAARRNGHGCVRIHLADLTVHPLRHRLIFPVFRRENLYKLLGTDVIGKGPEALSRSAG